MPAKDLSPVSSTSEFEATLSALTQKVARWTEGKDKAVTPIQALSLFRINKPTEQACYLHEPSICFTVQGAKRVLLGEETYVYDKRHFLISSLDLPVMVKIIETPYLGIKLKLDLRVVAQLMADSNVLLYQPQSTSRSMALGEISPPLANAFLRLLDLLDKPEDIPILAPLIQREILYRLLVSDQGPRLRQVAGSQSHQIAKAIDWLKENFNKALSVDELAAYACMSTSSFHHHFRSFTAMSPLQFQKKLRLHEARRLMLTEHMDATTTALQVGYESPSQFSREYSRLFGASPLRDIKNLHQASLVRA